MSNLYAGKLVLKRSTVHKKAKSGDFLDVVETFWRVCPPPPQRPKRTFWIRQWSGAGRTILVGHTVDVALRGVGSQNGLWGLNQGCSFVFSCGGLSPHNLSQKRPKFLNFKEKVCQIRGEIWNSRILMVLWAVFTGSAPTTCFAKLRPWAEPIITAQSTTIILQFNDFSSNLTQFLAQVKDFRPFLTQVVGAQAPTTEYETTPLVALVHKSGPCLRNFDCWGKSGHWRTTFT